MSSKLIAEFAHAFADHGNGCLKPAVNQDVTVARGDEERRDVGSTHIVDIADHPERLEWPVHRFQGPFDLGIDERLSQAIDAWASVLSQARRPRPPCIRATSMNTIDCSRFIFRSLSEPASAFPGLYQGVRSDEPSWLLSESPG